MLPGNTLASMPNHPLPKQMHLDLLAWHPGIDLGENCEEVRVLYKTGLQGDTQPFVHHYLRCTARVKVFCVCVCVCVCRSMCVILHLLQKVQQGDHASSALRTPYLPESLERH